MLPPAKLEELKRFDPGEHSFVTIRRPDPDLIAELQATKIPFKGRLENKWFSTFFSLLAPALIFVAIWLFALKRMGGAQGMMAIGKSKAKVYMEKRTGVTFADAAGIDEAKEELMQVVSRATPDTLPSPAAPNEKSLQKVAFVTTRPDAGAASGRSAPS